MEQRDTRHVRLDILQSAQNLEAEAVRLPPRPVPPVHVIAEREDQRHHLLQGARVSQEVAGATKIRQFRRDVRDSVLELGLEHQTRYPLREMIDIG